jgi:hypothetical protein
MSNIWSGLPLIFGADSHTARPARILTTVQYPVTVTRDDARSVSLRLDPAENLSAMLTIFRRESDPIVLGDQFDVPGLHVEVTEMGPGSTPRAARFTFDRPLEDPALQWAAWNGHEVVPFTPPPVGASVVVGKP